ncbi:hypothetical protein M422DRAFT_269821 [Sphaerobolus stellatus SS14]|uniref:Unplaced genomic scaffold SPHSTscaffold_221, whole genome shotgun sequence n=1 Tax=Sphaerobolus stellatus (strain SS14) TaxID=990650 RepID=A0A0C9UIV7_SPHS4|nr:hypothetical protein M422DRAFT_269821 [Sphaerobolus stellatus SS14]
MSTYVPKVHIPKWKCVKAPGGDPREGGVRAHMLSILPDIFPLICSTEFLPPLTPQFLGRSINPRENSDGIFGDMLLGGRYVWHWR